MGARRRARRAIHEAPQLRISIAALQTAVQAGFCLGGRQALTCRLAVDAHQHVINAKSCRSRCVAAAASREDTHIGSSADGGAIAL